jgi:hypothetical protein
MAQPVAPPEPAEPAPADRNRRALIVLGAFAAAALLFFGIIRPLVFGGDGGGDSEISLPPSTPGATAPSAVTSTTAPAPEETFEVFGSKNPFQPPNGIPGASTATTAPGDGGGGTTATTTPAGGTGTTETTLPAGGGASGSGTEPRASQQVALLDIYQQNGGTVADVRVNGTVYTQLAPGEQFAGSYEVVTLQGTCGSFLFGDERFRLCKGEEVLK